MYEYDVIIIGAGIAGCGLAYNLKKQGFKGSVLVLDKKGAGANKGYDYRLTFRNTIKEYGINYIAEHKGAKFYLDTKNEVLKVEEPVYSFDYNQVCKRILKDSGFVFKKEQALEVEGSIIKTDKSSYKFKYLIDCSGIGFFLRKKLGLKIPFNYFIGEVRTLRGKTTLDKKYYNILAKNNGFVEDVYFVDNKIVGADWQITDKFNPKKPNYNLIKAPKERFYTKEISNKVALNSRFIYYPISPSFPLVYQNYAFLGDSFGNAEPFAGCGIEAILGSSKLLAGSIISDNLSSFEKKWKDKNLENYLRYLATKIKLNDKTDRLKILGLLKEHPKLFLKIFKNKHVNLPQEVKREIPFSYKLKTIYLYCVLKFKYWFNQL